MRLRYAGTCRECGVNLPAGVTASYDSATKTVVCDSCMSSAPTETVFEPGTAGASARREFDKRKASREARTRANHPLLGGAILALTEEPQSTRAWATGARGEELLGRRLDKLVEHGFRVLHDRRIPGTAANIDHIVVAPSGVFVIDAKRYQGKPRLLTEGGIFRARTEKLMVGSRDCTKLVGGVTKQVSLVSSAPTQAGIHGVPVRGMLCFVEADWPLLGGDFTIANVDVLWPAKAIDRMRKPGPNDAAAVEAVAHALAGHFPVA